jgi:hypothetical protein
MSRRLDIELTSTRDDGTWTWRAAGAKVPKGVVVATLLPNQSKIGDVLKIEADFDIDGITVLSVVTQRDKSQKATLLQLIDDKPFVGVTEKLAKKSRDDKPRRGKQGPRTDRPDREPREPREPRADRPNREPRAPRPDRKSFPPAPEVPKRPIAKRLKPKRVHRTAVLESLPVEQRGVAERALAGGLAAVREAIKSQNAQLKKDGKAEVKADGLISMASDILPKLRVAEWLDKAEAAKADLDLLDLRDLRAVVVGSDDPMVVRDETTRALATELKAALKSRQEKEMSNWIDDMKSAVEVSRVVRALKLSGEPPKAGVLFPVELGAQIAKAATESLASDAGADRWIAVLEALAFSPIRAQVKPAAAPVAATDALRETVKRLSPLLPQIAALFGIDVVAGVQAPKPLRPPRQARQVRKPREKKEPKLTIPPAPKSVVETPVAQEVVVTAVTETPVVETAVAVAPVVEVQVAESPVEAEAPSSSEQA